MKLAPKLTILFLLLSILPTAVVGYLAFKNGRRTIVQETIDHLVSINLLKSNELKRWVEANKSSIEELTQRPLVRHYAAVLTKHDIPDHPYQKAKANIIEDHLKPRSKYRGFFELFLMCPRHGLISVSTDKKQEGKYRDTFPYFKEAKNRTYVQGVYYSPVLEQPAMTIGAPIKDKQGNLLGVLAGRLNLGELSKIISLQTGESPTEDTYLVNTFNFFVTEPRFGQDYMLKKAVRTEGVEAGLSGRDGTGFYKDYRGVPVIGAYKWLPEFNMCIITEIGQAEAFTPIVHLAWIITGIASAISLQRASWASSSHARSPALCNNLLQGLRRSGLETWNTGWGQRLRTKSADFPGRLTGWRRASKPRWYHGANWNSTWSSAPPNLKPPTRNLKPFRTPSHTICERHCEPSMVSPVSF